MTNQEIEGAAIEYRGTISGYTTHFESFISGATMVNERQPYSREDMKDFFMWLNPKIIEHDGTNFLIWGGRGKSKNFDELLKLWEETK